MYPIALSKSPFGGWFVRDTAISREIVGEIIKQPESQEYWSLVYTSNGDTSIKVSENIFENIDAFARYVMDPEGYWNV